MTQPISREPLLGEDHLERLNMALEMSEVVLEHIERAEQAGIDMQPFRKTVEETQARARNIKRAFFPNR